MSVRTALVRLAALPAALSLVGAAQAQVPDDPATLSDAALSEVHAAGLSDNALQTLLGSAPFAAAQETPGAWAENPAPIAIQARQLADLAQADRPGQQLRLWAASVGVNGSISASSLAAMGLLAPVAPLLPVIGLPIFGLLPMLPPPKKG
jgi:hypothetical protein